jgi:hypothetical protein
MDTTIREAYHKHDIEVGEIRLVARVPPNNLYYEIVDNKKHHQVASSIAKTLAHQHIACTPVSLTDVILAACPDKVNQKVQIALTMARYLHIQAPRTSDPRKWIDGNLYETITPITPAPTTTQKNTNSSTYGACSKLLFNVMVVLLIVHFFIRH